MSKDQVEVLDFRLDRLDSNKNGQSTSGPQTTVSPSEKELQVLINELSLNEGLKQLVKSTATDNSLRYRGYNDMADILRGLTLNFANITKLHKWAGFIFFKHVTAYSALYFYVLKNANERFSVSKL